MDLRTLFKGLRPTAGLLNLPLYDWRSIYTTNYDDLVEQAYQRKGKTLGVVNSNFDFGNAPKSVGTRLYKLHGTIEKDVSFGDAARLIVTQEDYTVALDFREHLFNSVIAHLGVASRGDPSEVRRAFKVAWPASFAVLTTDRKAA